MPLFNFTWRAMVPAEGVVQGVEAEHEHAAAVLARRLVRDQELPGLQLEKIEIRRDGDETMHMGKLLPEGENIVGACNTLELKVKRLVFKPNKDKRGDTQPDYRVFADDAEIGAGWIHHPKDGGRPYISAVLDDPSLKRTIRCNLVRAATGDEFNLIWNRPE